MTDLEVYNKVEYRAGNVIQAAVTTGFLESFSNGSRVYFFTGICIEMQPAMLSVEYRASDTYDDFSGSVIVPIEFLNENTDQSVLVAYFENLVAEKLDIEAKQKARIKEAVAKVNAEKDRKEFERLKELFGE